MTAALIWAQARGGVIGAGGVLPWRLPEDLRLFRDTTKGGTVLMGRRTWESLPDRARPLPGRVNLVLTGDPAWTSPGAATVGSVREALDGHPDLWGIGGASVYAALLPHASRVVLTEIDEDFPGDVFAPALDPAEWIRTPRAPERGWAVSETGLRWRVTDLARA